ncbi:hypothetical protein ATE84_4443 [Aquimarina sp. MAR_2010_214]|uniref:hypothetical protein n=1 Tax=Aquimarina sp. MAR_2010_214 TaxID=1250026 RepID=UPI000C715359|nr:hypothetical protein [Aquimarina sp. MAR_2010_214]PKV52331.1 hypothetical protein ATE84_4443 [Aquimarina sp. MAR_2010_214]
MIRTITIIFIFIGQIQRECYGQTSVSDNIFDIKELIKLKKNDKRQQKMLVNFKKNSQEEDDISVIELPNYFELTVTHHQEKKDYTGGAEGYTLYKKTGKIEMIWHEHPMKLPE